MKKIYLSIILFVFFIPFVYSQEVSSPTLDFEKVVVKEHFVTKKEIKEYMDQKMIEYQRTTENQIGAAFVEMERIFDTRINKFVFKLTIGLFAIMFFSNSIWYFMKKKLDRRYEKIIGVPVSQRKVDKQMKKLQKSEEFKRLKEEKKKILQDLESLKNGFGEQREER